MSTPQTQKRPEKERRTRVRPECPWCGPFADVYRLRDRLGRAIRTRPRVYACDSCGSVFTAR